MQAPSLHAQGWALLDKSLEVLKSTQMPTEI